MAHRKRAPAPEPGAPARVRPDWQAVERDYRTGKFTLRELEHKHGAANSTIARRAAREGWSQDLSAAVRQATNAKLIAGFSSRPWRELHKSNGETFTDLPPLLTWLGNSVRMGNTPIAYGALAMLLLYALAFVVLRDTAAGRHVYAVGNNIEAARLAGINTNRVLLSVYMLSGLCAGAAALLSIARTGVGDPQSGQTENLDTVTAVVLGGTSLFGGRGIVVGSLVGALIVGVFRNGLTLMGVSSVYQILVTGVLVILAVATDQWSRKA